MVRRHLGRDRAGAAGQAALGPAQDLHAAGGRDVADVQPGADMLGQQHVAGDDRLLGDRRPARHAQPGRRDALVHLGVHGQSRLLGVLGDHAVERLDVLQGPPHQARVGHAEAVVGEHAHPGGRVGHGAQLGQVLALEPDRDRPDRTDIDQPGLPTEPPDLLHHAGRVGRR
jgi:hypothetical protein